MIKKVFIFVSFLLVIFMITQSIISEEAILQETDNSKTYFSGYGKFTVNNFVINKNNGGIDIKAENDGASMKYGTSIESKNNLEIDRSFKYLKKDSFFKFNKNIELISANFVVGDDAEICTNNGCITGIAEYKLGDYSYKIPKESKVEYIKGDKNNHDIVKIIQKDGSVVYSPKVIDQKNKKQTKISYNLPNDAKTGDGLIFKKNDDEYRMIKKDESNFELYYDAKMEKFFIKGAQQIDNLNIGSLQSSNTYLFLGENIPENFDKSAVYLGNGRDPEIKLFTPAGDKGFSVRFLPSNGKNYGGINVKENENLVLLTTGSGKDFGTGKDISSISEIGIKNIDGKPLVNTKGAFVIFNGNKLIRYNENTNDNVKVSVLDDKLSSTNSDGKKMEFDFRNSNAVPIQIHVKDKKGNDLKYKNLKTGEMEDMDIFVSTENGNKQGYMTTGTKGTISRKVKIGSLSENLQKVFNGLTNNQQTELLKKSSSEISGKLEKIKQENEKKVKPPVIKSQVKSNVPNLPSQFFKSGKLVGETIYAGNPKESSEVIVVYGGDWCPKCRFLEKKLNENIDRMIKEDFKIPIIKIKVDQLGNSNIGKLNFNSYPHTIIFRDGKEIGSISSLPWNYESTLNKILNQK